MANLYVALNQNKDFQNRLDKSVEEIRNRHPQFKKTVNKENAAEHLMGLLFPNGMPMDYLIFNLNLNESEDKKIQLAVRPAMTGGLNLPLAQGCSVVATGYWPLTSRSPVFIIEKFLEVADVDVKEYEKNITVFVRHTDPNIRENRPENVLDNELANSLPLISVTTQKKLTDWYDFIQWKRQLVSEKTRGLRFINRRIVTSEKQGYVWEFDVISESKEVLDKDRKVLGRKDISVFSLTASEDEWVFKLPSDNKKNRRDRTINIGQIANFEYTHDISSLTKTTKDSETTKYPDWNKPQFAKIRVALSEEQENSLINVSDKEEKALIEELESELGQVGFLTISAVGDLALINRHKQALDKLRDQGGLSPYLSSYLFDVKKAENPQTFVEVGEWHNLSLNSFQQNAVNKIINAPDLCLIQGPPGTGKTTVIAEAIVQLVKQGKKVLLASQAHTAVDNALDRLGFHPELRVLRLANNQKSITDEGKNFSGVNALARYYTSLANDSETKYLTPFKTTEKQLEKFQRWLQQAEPLAANWQDIKNRLQEHEQQGQRLTTERDKAWQELQQQEQRQQQQTIERNQLQQLQKYLGEGSHFNEDFPVNLQIPEQQASALVQAINELSCLSFKFSFSFANWQAEKEQRAAILFALLEDWRKIQANEASLQQDLQRLLASGSGGLTNPEMTVKLQQIQEEIKHIEEQMEADESLVSIWKNKRAEIKRLKESSSGMLDAKLYEVFEDADIWCKPVENAILLAERLQQRLTGLANKKQTVELARLQLLDAVTRQLNSYTICQPDDTLFQQAKNSLNNNEVVLQGLNEEKTACEKNLKECSASYPVQQSKVSISLAKEEIDKLQQKLASLKSEQGAWRKLAEDWVGDLTEDNRAQQDWEHFSATFVPSCNVVAITCNEREQTLEEFGLVSFDVAIIDEVSKATPLELLLPIMRARTTVLVGDHRQLPPLFQESSDEITTVHDAVEEAEEDNNRSLLTTDNLNRFEKLVTASLFKEHFENADESIRARLEIQFRMHPQIMDLVNYFYERRLSCGLKNPDEERAHHVVLFDKFKKAVLTAEDHVLWIDTTRSLDGLSMHQEDIGSDGKPIRTNRLEAKLIVNTLCQLDEQMEGKGKLDVGVVSFYALQCKVIRNEMRKMRPPKGQFQNLVVDVNTVIRYQGKEKSIILVSLVRHDGRDPEKNDGIQRRKSSRANVARYEFINVALSRAQKLLVVFGARSMFESYEVELPNMDNQGTTKRLVYKDIFQQLDRDARILPAHRMLNAENDTAKPTNRNFNQNNDRQNRKR